MSSHRTFVRKIVYAVAIGVLLIPLFLLSHPATNAVKGVPGSPGGKLAQLRDRYRLSQAQLGQIDPTSVTIKLATLGMRGVAANILWEKAIEQQLKKDWANRAATLNQITKVQPNFVNVWLNQAWNVSYNISVEFDDYRQRYRWIVKGFDFLKEGIQYNTRQPRLPWELGWMIVWKIGKADEAKQFRKLFKEDNDFHERDPLYPSRPPALRDSWLVGKDWFREAVRMVDTLGVSMMGKGPLYYRSNAPMCQMDYADNLEKDGIFGEKAKAEWATAASDWRRYGDEDIPTSYMDPFTQQPMTHRLNDREKEQKLAEELAAKLDAIQPGLREKIGEEKRAALTESQREALDTPEGKRTGRQYELAEVAKEVVRVTHDEVARDRRIPGPKRKEAIQLAKEANGHQQIASNIDRDRDVVNFVYWRMRAEVEQTDDMLTTRKLIYQGDRALADNELVAARNAYNQGFAGWRKVLDKFPAMGTDTAAGEDLMDMIRRYRRILSLLDETFPEKFILQDIIDAHETRAVEQAKEEAQKQDGGQKAEPGGDPTPSPSGIGPR